MPLADLEFLEPVFKTGGIVHVSGVSGAGKTLFAALVAAKVSRAAHVDWLSTDGKNAFLGRLKQSINERGGRERNLTITTALGHADVLEAILSVNDRLRSDTQLVVIDPITRVLDMGREEADMWGRVLFEEVLPSLAGVALSQSICVLMTSEVRSNENGPQPVYGDKIASWSDLEVWLERPSSSRITRVSMKTSTSSDVVLLGSLKTLDSGSAVLEDLTFGVDSRECSASTSSN